MPVTPADPPVEPAEQFVSTPDRFERLWTPHRLAYIQGEDARTGPSAVCPFCVAPGRSDADGLIVHRGELCFVVMNLFPYNTGHVLVCPYRHIPLYTDLTVAETAEYALLTQIAMRALTAACGPAGFNLGMNQGAVGGAGIAAHLHQHVVPRWSGDSNFLPIIAQTKALPILLEDMRQSIVSAWASAAQDYQSSRASATRADPDTGSALT